MQRTRLEKQPFSVISVEFLENLISRSEIELYFSPHSLNSYHLENGIMLSYRQYNIVAVGVWPRVLSGHSSGETVNISEIFQISYATYLPTYLIT